VLYENKYDNPPRVLSEEIAATMNGMLSRVITEGTGKAARLQGWQAAGKSGTTQSFRDALFVGYTSNLTTGVWFGNDDGTSMKKVTGGGLPARAWKEFMTAAHSGLSPSPLFGLGAGGVPPLMDMQQPAPENAPSSIGDIISNALGGGTTDNRAYPAAPASPTPNQPDGQPGGLTPPANIPSRDIEPRYSAGNGPVPPADIGGEAPDVSGPKQTTLLDILMGR